MNEREESSPIAHELMELHMEAMFKHDKSRRLRAVNEPWPGEKPAPRFFMGRTIEGTALCRFRYDVPDTLIEQLERLCADEPNVSDFLTKPKHFEAYMKLLQGERYTMGPCYRVSGEASPTQQAVAITRENIRELELDGFEWLTSEIDYVQPCVALVHDNRVVSICRSVRITPKAHEAGLETLAAFRGRGYAAAVVAGWAREVRRAGAWPLYSTLWENLASQRVAGKLALSLYGVNFTVY